MFTSKTLLLTIAAVSTALARPQTTPPHQDIVIECFPGAGGFPFSVREIETNFCLTAASLGEGFPNATAGQVLSPEVQPTCRVFASTNCQGLSTTFGATETEFAPGIAGHPGSYSCP